MKLTQEICYLVWVRTTAEGATRIEAEDRILAEQTADLRRLPGHQDHCLKDVYQEEVIE